MKPKHDILNSAKLKEKRIKLFKRRLIIFGSLFVLVLIGLVYVSGLPSLSITKINISGNEVTDTADIAGVIEHDLQGKYFLLFPKRNFLLYPKHALERDVLLAFPRIKSVVIKRL